MIKNTYLHMWLKTQFTKKKTLMVKNKKYAIEVRLWIEETEVPFLEIEKRIRNFTQKETES